jgi:hypothetical protein
MLDLTVVLQPETGRRLCPLLVQNGLQSPRSMARIDRLPC